MSKKPVRSKINKAQLNPVFHFKNNEEDDTILTKNVIKQALKSRSLNLSARNLATVPEKLWTMREEVENKSDDRYDLDRTRNEDDLWWNQHGLTNLDLSSNVLTFISGDIQLLMDLTVLNIQDNALTTLPKEIGMLEKLTKLNASHNKIQELPFEFFQLRELRILNLSHNSMKELSYDVSDLVMLENFDISNNDLTEIPKSIGFCTRLIEFTIHHNHITELPDDVTNLRLLQKLDVMQNDLKILPKFMGDLHRLEFFYCHHNDITELPMLEGCDALQELHISNNFIKEMPADFCNNLPNLKVLDLRDNKIEKLPEEIAMIQSLMRLDLSNNSISSVPTSLATLAHLVSLQLEGNPIKSIRSDIIKCGTQRILKTLKERGGGDFKTSQNAAKPTVPENQFPDQYQMKRARILSLGNKMLEEIPDDVFETAKDAEIQTVDLSKNKLQCLPEGLVKLETLLIEMNVSHNQMKAIPSFISQFKHIRYINLAKNLLEDLPKEFGLLISVRELNIANNRFTSLPKCIYELASLEILLACDNKVVEIDASPTGLGALKYISNLDLSNNNLTSVPAVLGNIKTIKNLQLSGNAFRQPRHQIIEKGTETIMAYLRDRIPKLDES